VGDQPAGHDVGERLFVPGDSLVHRLPPHVKVLTALLTVLVIVLTPPQPPWVFGGYALLLVIAYRVAGIGLRTVAPRLLIEIPFVVFALLLPFVGQGPDISVGPLQLSEAGLWAAWNILAKATLGLGVSVLLAATTSTRDLVAGLQRLRVPDVLVQIFASMVRYVHVVTGEWTRMSRARAARGFEVRGPRSWPVVAQGLGTLFVRSYERGERVHLAMVSRGYTGRLPDLTTTAPAIRDWFVAAVLPVTAAILALASWGWAR
jgi:cobalt/nickel transport system permease protein